MACILLLALAALPVPLSAEAPVAVWYPLQVQHQRCECVVPTGNPNQQYFLVLGSLADGSTQHRIKIHAESATGPVDIPLSANNADLPVFHQAARSPKDQLTVRGKHDTQPARYKSVPARQKVFSVFKGGHDLFASDNYAAVIARLVKVGEHCQVYLDADYGTSDLSSMVDDIVQTFDREIYPASAARRGIAHDVDGDGRFTILLTPWLDRMAASTTPVMGYVRGTDFDRGVPRPLGNACDMMYISTSARDRRFLRSVIAHEYTHAVVLTQRILGNALAGNSRRDEESWLDEGIAHLVEDEHGYSWHNLDYRISAFLNAPFAYPLVVSDYYENNLWRTPGLRGATYLFLRHACDQHGPDLLTKLVRTQRTGKQNLESAAGEPFAQMFRQWSLAMLHSGMHLPIEKLASYQRLDLRRVLDRHVLCGPYFDTLEMDRNSLDLTIAGSAIAYVLLHSPRAEYTRLRISAEPGTCLQASLVVLPPRMGRLQLTVLPGPAPGESRIEVTAHGTAVTLEQITWEVRSPNGDGQSDTNFEPAQSTHHILRQSIGKDHLKAGERVRSCPLLLPQTTVIFKAVGRDAHGFRIAACAVRN